MNYGTAAPNENLAAAAEDFLGAFPELRGKKFLLFLGRLHVKKGIEELIQAFASVAADHLVIAGPSRDPAYLEKLHYLTSRAGIANRTIFTGMLTGLRKWGAFALADAFVLPSHQENFGIAIVEALACGRPVLISNQVNIWREIVEDGAGFAEEDTPAGTRRLLERWVATRPEGREAMRARAQSCFAERFEIEHAVDSFLAVLQSPPRTG